MSHELEAQLLAHQLLLVTLLTNQSRLAKNPKTYLFETEDALLATIPSLFAMKNSSPEFAKTTAAKISSIIESAVNSL